MWSFFLIATVSHCPRVVQFECEGCAEGWHVKERELIVPRGSKYCSLPGPWMKRGEHVRVFPSIDMVRWWQGWFYHTGWPDMDWDEEPDYQRWGLFVAYCPQCSPKLQREVSVWPTDSRVWHEYAKVDWIDIRGTHKYNTLPKRRKREVQEAIERYKVGWDKECEELTKEREEYRKKMVAYYREKQIAEASYQSYHYQVEEEWDDEVMPFC